MAADRRLRHNTPDNASTHSGLYACWSRHGCMSKEISTPSMLRASDSELLDLLHARGETELKQSETPPIRDVLLLEPQSGADRESGRSSQLTELAFSAVPSLLIEGEGTDGINTSSGSSARLVPFHQAGRSVAQADVGASSGVRASHPVFDSASSTLGGRLVLATTPGSGVRVNGLPAPIISPLHLGDQVSLRPGRVYHVSRRLQAAAIPTPPEYVGTKCPLCLVEFAAVTRVVPCSNCEVPRHMEGEEVPEANDRLECAEMGPCPVCNTPRPETSGGFAFVPDGFDTEVS